MKPQNRFVEFFNRLVSYFRDPNPKTQAAIFGTQVANNPEAVIGETRLHAAETVLEAIKRTATARAQHPRPSKLARRMAALR
jgi:hypothetical protein